MSFSTPTHSPTSNLNPTDPAQTEQLTEQLQTIYINNSCGGLFVFKEVPTDDIEMWFDNNDIGTLVGNNLSSCDWGVVDTVTRVPLVFKANKCYSCW
jgi:hypothetical protein